MIGKNLKILIACMVYCYDRVMQTLHLKQTGGCVVLCYHGIPDDQRDRFAHQMDLLKRYSIPIKTDHTEPLKPGQRYSVVTFDDGLRSFSINALPELESRNIPATIFVPIGFLGQACTWMRPDVVPLKGRDRVQYETDRVMNEKEMKALPEELVSIGGHGVRHIHLTALSLKEAKLEMIQSRDHLRQLLNRNIPTFSFPRGRYNDAILAAAREAGYMRVFSIEDYPAFQIPNEFLTGRCCVEPMNSNLEFYLKIMNAYRWQPMATKIKSFLTNLFRRNGKPD